jgi:hypothetical protein
MKKSKVDTENKPGLIKPTTTTIGHLRRKEEKMPRAMQITATMAAQPASEQNEPALNGL